MAKSLTWRWVLIIVILAGWIYSFIPPTDRDFYETLLKEAGKSGQVAPAELVQLMDDAKAIRKSTDPDVVAKSDYHAVERAAEEAGVRLSSYITIHGKTNPSNEDVLEHIRKLAAGKFRLGLDLKGGTEYTIAFKPEDVPEDRKAVDVRDQIIEIIRNRVDSSGVLEPEIMPFGDNQVIVRIPTTDDVDRIRFRKLLQQTAKLNFHILHPENDQKVREEAEKQQTDPGYRMVIPGYTRNVMSENRDGVPTEEVIFYRNKPEPASGKHLVDAFPTVGQFGDWQIAFKLNFEGAALFGEMTGNHVNERMAIVLDKTVYGAPVIRDKIAGGSGVISGSFSREEASQLAVALRCGNLPVNINIEGEMSTNPTLGLASVKSGIIAGVSGIVLVAIFMLCYYMFSGIVANIALIMNIVLLAGTLPILDATITLPGLAGIILTIGMAVDANVLIFERIREEMAAGKRIESAISRGYASAFSTILDANLTTLFTAFILIKFGSGPIKGFGVTLSIGILASMFTALFVTRTIFDSMIHAKKLDTLKMPTWFKITNVRFFLHTKKFVALSCLLIGLTAITMGVRGSGMLGVDFLGGTSLSYTYVNEVNINEVKAALADQKVVDLSSPRVHYKNSSVTGDANLLEIVTSKVLETTSDGSDSDASTKLEGLLNQKFPDAQFKTGNVDQIGALVGVRFAKKALVSIFWALVVIIIYISFRFELSYALGAVVALVHDVFIGAGIFLMWGMGDRQISLPVIAALLTIIGYSLNDTIVVFDRIRENVALLKNKSLEEIAEISINQTLSRTILTSGTTIIVVLTLYLFGGGPINDFALIMLLGIIIGTYSSVFVATPVMLKWHNRQLAKAAQAKQDGADNSKVTA